MATMIDGQRFFLRAFQTGPLEERIERIYAPDPADLSDEALVAHCRRFVKTNYHPSGTCRMGPADDPMAVLDSRLRVRGVERLRVCDLSAMPNINAGNTNAPAMMMGTAAPNLSARKSPSLCGNKLEYWIARERATVSVGFTLHATASRGGLCEWNFRQGERAGECGDRQGQAGYWLRHWIRGPQRTWPFRSRIERARSDSRRGRESRVDQPSDDREGLV